MAHGTSFVELGKEFARPSSVCNTIFNETVKKLNLQYQHLFSDLEIWKPFFDSWAAEVKEKVVAIMQEKGWEFSEEDLDIDHYGNISVFIDGTFRSICRPDGHVAAREGFMFDLQVSPLCICTSTCVLVRTVPTKTLG